MKAIEKAEEIARATPLRVVFPEGDDPRIAQAMQQLEKRDLADPIPLAKPNRSQLEALMAARPMREGIAARMLERPLIRAAAMLACGEADVMVAGAHFSTRRVIEAGTMALGYAPGITTASSFFLLQMPNGQELILADCAVNVDPTSAQLADIARSSERCAQVLLGYSDVALLSFATGRSGTGEAVAKVQEAALASGFSGPLQADAALNANIAQCKGADGAGGANTLIFPNLDAGNIGYKLLKELAGAKAYGPVLQGFRKPICDLSRGPMLRKSSAPPCFRLHWRAPAISRPLQPELLPVQR